jgi:hypothetical protein
MRGDPIHMLFTLCPTIHPQKTNFLSILLILSSCLKILRRS